MADPVPIRRRAARILRALSLALLCAWVAAGPVAPSASAADAEEGWAYDVWHETMSPFCPGRTLAECPSPQADELRMWILMQEAAGASRAEVEAMLHDRFGDRILSAPRATGWGLSAYVVPIVVFLAGGVLVAVFLRRSVREPREAGPPSAAAGGPVPRDPELERVVDAELRGSA